MEQLFKKSNLLLRNQQQGMSRFLTDRIYWTDRLIGILGARGNRKNHFAFTVC